jgi:LysM repeat protein
MNSRSSRSAAITSSADISTQLSLRCDLYNRHVRKTTWLQSGPFRQLLGARARTFETRRRCKLAQTDRFSVNLCKSVASGFFVCIFASACVTSETSTAPNADIEKTRIAAGIAAIPTAALIRTSVPQILATNTAAPTVSFPTAQPAVDVTSVAVQASQATTAAAEHVVLAGETLSTLAVKYNTSIAALQLSNNLDDQSIQAGARLKLPTARLADDEGVFWFVYVVQPGDTFGAIALKNGISIADLLRVNKLTDAGRINAGQRLIVPVKQPASNAAAAAPVATAVIVVDAVPAATLAVAPTPIPLLVECAVTPRQWLRYC